MFGRIGPVNGGMPPVIEKKGEAGKTLHSGNRSRQIRRLSGGTCQRSAQPTMTITVTSSSDAAATRLRRRLCCRTIVWTASNRARRSSRSSSRRRWVATQAGRILETWDMIGSHGRKNRSRQAGGDGARVGLIIDRRHSFASSHRNGLRSGWTRFGRTRFTGRLSRPSPIRLRPLGRLSRN